MSKKLLADLENCKDIILKECCGKKCSECKYREKEICMMVLQLIKKLEK